MIPYIEHNSLPLGPVTIHLFGVLVAIGILVGAHWTHRRGRELGLTAMNISQMITWTLVTGFICAHLFAVFAYKTKGPNPTLFEIINPFGGLSSYGGFMGALLGLFVWAWRHHQKVMPYADSLGYGLSIGWMFGRLGCYSAHDHPGRFTDIWLSVPYPDGRRHDLGFDEALWAGGITLLFWALSRKNRPLGLYVSLLAFFYGPVRFAFDSLRVADVAGADIRYYGYTPAQYGSVLVSLMGIGLLIWTLGHTKKRAE